MSEIEIYAKIMEAIKDEDPNAVSIALEFVMRKNQNRRDEVWQKQNALMQAQCASQGTIGSGLAGNYANPSYAHDAAVKMVRDIAREEIANSKTDDAKEAA